MSPQYPPSSCVRDECTSTKVFSTVEALPFIKSFHGRIHHHEGAHFYIDLFKIKLLYCIRSTPVVWGNDLFRATSNSWYLLFAHRRAPFTSGVQKIQGKKYLLAKRITFSSRSTSHFTNSSLIEMTSSPGLLWSRTAKAVALVLCVFFFCLQLRVILNMYRNGKTNTAISYDTHSSMELPHVTVCPQVPHVGEGAMYFEEDYQNRSHVLTDFLDLVSI